MNLLRKIMAFIRSEILAKLLKMQDPVKLLSLEIEGLKAFLYTACEDYKRAFADLQVLKDNYTKKESEVTMLENSASDILKLSQTNEMPIEEAKERALTILIRKNRIKDSTDKIKKQIDHEDIKIAELLKRLELSKNEIEMKQDDLKMLQLRQSMNKSSKNLNSILNKTGNVIGSDNTSQIADEAIDEETIRVDSEQSAIISLSNDFETKQSHTYDKSRIELEELLNKK